MFIKIIKDNIISHGTLRVPWLTLFLTGVTIGLYAAGRMLFDLFVFDKLAIQQGQVWRFLTGHFVHCNWEHFFWDLVGLVILGSIIEINDRRHVIPSLMISCLIVSSWLYLGDTQYPTYCGLSGALNGLLVVAVLFQWRATKNKILPLVLVLTIAKMIFEFTTHQTIFTSLAAQSVPGSHAAGFIAGILYMVINQSDHGVTLGH